MSVVPHPSHPGWWQIKYYPDGKKGGLRVQVVEGSRELALEIEAGLRSQIRTGGSISTGVPTLAEVIPAYVEHFALDHLAPGVVIRHLDLWRQFAGPMPLTAITEDVVAKYKMSRQSAGIKPTTINKELSALSGLLKWARKQRYIAKVIEIVRFPAKMTKAPLPNVPTREEVLALLDGMIWPQCGLFCCLYFAGLRANEARFLRAEDVHLDRSCMIVRGKGNKQRVVVVVDKLRLVLERRLKEVKTGLLWTTRKGEPMMDLKQPIKWAAKRVGLDRHIYPHLLRHAFGVHATKAGIGMRALQFNMGHTSIQTTTIYTQLAADDIIGEIGSKWK